MPPVSRGLSLRRSPARSSFASLVGATLVACAVATAVAACGGASRGTAVQCAGAPPLLPGMVCTEPDGLRVAAWNIRCLLDTDGETAFCNTEWGTDVTHPRDEADYARLREIAEGMALDVVLLQEVENNDAVERVFPGWQIHTFGNTVQRVGIAIAPGADVALRSVDALSSLAVTERSRPGVEAVLVWRGEPVHVLGVHLKSGCFDDPLDADGSCETLVAQLAALEAWLAARRDAGDAVLVLGDLNRRMEGAEGFEERLVEAGGPMLRLTEGRVSACWDHMADVDGAPIYPEYIDHILVSSRALDAWGTPTFEQVVYPDADPLGWWALSDHCPIVATFGDDTVAPRQATE